MHRCANGSHYEADIVTYFFNIQEFIGVCCKGKGAKGATVWIRAFVKLFNNTQLHLQWSFGVCVYDRVIYSTGQGHLHKASVRSTVHLQTEQKRKAKVKEKGTKKSRNQDRC